METAAHPESRKAPPTLSVPFLDLRVQHAPLRTDILHAWESILASADFVGGHHVAEFEQHFAAACGVAHCVAVSNGTEALVLALRALGAEPGDEIIVPANTFIATAESVSLVGATPVFVDVSPGTWTVAPDSIRKAITPRTRGVIGVHLYGQPFDIDTVAAICQEHGLWLMEDSAQGHLAEYKGKRTGALAACAAFSFYPGKNLGATGEGGAVVTANDDIAERVRRLRDHGQSKKYHHQVIGCNARLPTLMAAALSIKLPFLPGWTEARRRHAATYRRLLDGVPGVELPEVMQGANPVYHLFVIHVQNRDVVLAQMRDCGVVCALHYPIPCHLQECYGFLGYHPGDLPTAEYNAAHCLSLPMFPELADEQVHHVCASLQDCLSQ